MIVDIKDVTGNIRFSTPINKGSKRKFTLMKEDYITLKFSLDHPVYFNLGDGIDNELGVFELIDLYKPVYNNKTGGYDYELRLDAYYWKWKNKKIFYTPEDSGREAGWNLTATLAVHMDVFLNNLKALGYKYRNEDFTCNIDNTVEQSSKFVSYDNSNLIDALTQLAETWGCEWWITDSKINFGRCEYSSSVDFKIGDLNDTENVNVNTMQRSDGQNSYATRIYAFGATRNLPVTYRKNLIFDVKKVNGRDITDTERSLKFDFFPSSGVTEEEHSINASLGGYALKDQTTYTYELLKSPNAGTYYVKSISNWVLQLAALPAPIGFPTNYLTRGRYSGTLYIRYNLDEKVITHYNYHTWITVDDDTTRNLESTFWTPKVIEMNIPTGASNLRIELTTEVIPTYPLISMSFLTAGIAFDLDFKEKYARTSVSFISGTNASKTYSATCVLSYDENGQLEDSIIRLPESVIASLGDRYTVNNIIKGKVPDNYFSKDDKEMTLNGVAQKRLMLPEGISYVDAYRYSSTGERIDIEDEHYDNFGNVEMSAEEAVEEVVIFEDEYPKYIGTLSEVFEPEYIFETDQEGKKTEKEYPVFSFKDYELKHFSNDFRLNEFRIAFQTGKLAGLDFALELKDSDDTGTTFKIIRNEDYGRYLPDDILFPQAKHIENEKEVPADTYILHGFDTAFISEQMVPDSEKALFLKTKEYVKKSMIDPSTYNCEMDSIYIYNEGNIRTFEIGHKVNLINKTYFEEGRQSRVIGFEWPLDIPYDHPIYTVGETASYSRLGAIESKVDSLTYKGQAYSGINVNGGNGASVYVIGVYDKTLPSDRNTFSSKRIINEIEERALSRTNADEAAGLISFSKGLISEELIEANNGLVVRRQEIMEVSPMALVEEDDALVEELSVRSDITTLGEITNVSKEADDISETNDLIVRLSGASEWSVDTTLFSNVSKLMEEVFPFTMSFSGGATYEKGSTQTISLSWSYDRDIISQSINRTAIAVDIRTKLYEGITTDTIYALSAVFNGQTYTKSTSVEFRLKKYYGVSAHESLTNEEILLLSNLWAERAQTSTVFDCTGGKFPYYILPTSMVSDIQFWIGGLRNSDWIEEIREITNAYGYTESYTIFRLNSIQTGVLNIEVK